jgi:hypothetical protein
MKRVILLLFIMVGSLKSFSCQPSYSQFGELTFVQDSVNPLKIYFSFKFYGDGFCSFQTDSCMVEWSCPNTGYYGSLPLTDTIVVNSAYPQAPILVYSGWHTFDSLPSDSLVYVSCLADKRPPAMNDPTYQQTSLVVEVTLNFAYLAYHTGVRSAYFNAPIVTYGVPFKPLYFDPEIQYQQGDSLWVTLTHPLVDCNTTGFITYPNQYLPGSHNVLTMYNPTGLLIWDAPQEPDNWDIAYLVSGYRDGVFAYSMMRDMLIKIYPYPVGVNDISADGITVSPNPASDRLIINTSINDLSVTVFDMTGRICPTPSSSHEIDVSALPSGVYFIRIQDSGGSVVRRFVKE